MADPRKAPFDAVLLADVVVATDIYPDYPDVTDGDFHLVRRHFDIRAFGVNAITGDAGDEMVEPHHERDDEPRPPRALPHLRGHMRRLRGGLPGATGRAS